MARLSAARRGYDRAWQRMRAQVLREEPWCRACFAEGRLTLAVVGDHDARLRLSPELRLDPANVVPLCASHHNAGKQSEERRGYSRRVDASGWPVDPRHPVNIEPKWTDSCHSAKTRTESEG